MQNLTPSAGPIAVLPFITNKNVTNPFYSTCAFGYQSTIINEANARFYNPKPLTLAWPETIPLPTPFPSSTLSAWRKTSRLQTPFLITSLSASPKTFPPPASFPSTTLALTEHEHISSKSFFQILYLISHDISLNQYVALATQTYIKRQLTSCTGVF